jgi:hypothetical protein
MASNCLKPGVNESFTGLLHRIRRHDFHAFDYYPFRRLAHFALRISLDRRVADFLEYINASDQFAERGVFPIKAPNRRKTDEELRTG